MRSFLVDMILDGIRKTVFEPAIAVSVVEMEGMK